ncbi:MAG: secondary thiamine-phosphate synthase enzyme YjbQ [Candidatus Omnitrophica bacterium]|nr:secondary thiamine-phosphate synthase enzyme YjbQ [Candidatus Omnitrophota bacterium]MDD5488810.1 secondary thiamine-phosphate synthase enzyme YjbQ [Candidatus Omnitrophota bacterium]
MSNNKIAIFSVDSGKKEELIDITGPVREVISASGVSGGVCHVFIPHTTAGVTINENADPDVRLDIIKGLGTIVPENEDYRHCEGNSPAHIKASIMGSSIQVMIEQARPLLGTWQGIYLCEFDGPRSRKVYVKIIRDQ